MENSHFIRAYKGIRGHLPPEIAQALDGLPSSQKNSLEEVRLRLNRPVYIVSAAGTRPLQNNEGQEIIANAGHIRTAVYRMTEGSVYALEEEFRRGYVTVAGGHRVGISGRVVLEGGRVKGIRDVFSLNFRIAKEVKNCGVALLPKLMERGKLCNTLIFSAPRGGKTTLLRDLTRLLSMGQGGNVQNVALIDQRSEIAGSFLGQPQLDVGPATDVLDGAPKAEGMMMAIRSLGPQVVVTDEVGDAEEKNAILEAVNSGISLLLSSHGGDYQELRHRPLLRELLEMGVFSRLVHLDSRDGPGHIAGIYNGKGVKL